MPIDTIHSKLNYQTRKIMQEITDRKEKILQDRIEFIRALNADLKQGYNAIKKIRLLPDIKMR